MQPHSVHSSPPPESGSRPRRFRATAWLSRRGVAVMLVLTSALAGTAIGRFAFWADPIPAMDTPWAWRLPELPAGIDPQYRRLCEEAETAAARAMEAYPGSPHSVSALGVTYYLAHDKRGELACWERCLDLDPGNALAYSRLFALAEEEADYQRIVDLAREAEAKNPQNIAHRGRLGSALMYLQQMDEAKRVLERYVQEGHGEGNDYLVLGEVCFQQNEFRSAKRYFEAAVALAPYDPAMYFSLAKACTKLGEADQAERYRAKFQELKDAEMAAHKGDTSPRDRVRDAVHIPVRACEIMRHVGKAYWDNNDLEWAETSWRRAAELDPTDIESRRLLSNLCTRSGRLEDSLTWVRELKKIDPQDRTHYRNEGLVLSRLKLYPEAERVFREICQREPLESFGYAALADLLVERGDNSAEIATLAKRAVELEPSGPNLFLLANVAGNAGDLATARSHLAGTGARPGQRRISAALGKHLQPAVGLNYGRVKTWRVCQARRNTLSTRTARPAHRKAICPGCAVVPSVFWCACARRPACQRWKTETGELVTPCIAGC